mmetsp:Transcript_3709/g.12731  ORF Transcript_3709/g.12731 Transcript_3709/m.12731 type:complete len:108 (-) Transcript_3709:631-954(-)
MIDHASSRVDTRFGGGDASGGGGGLAAAAARHDSFHSRFFFSPGGVGLVKGSVCQDDSDGSWVGFLLLACARVSITPDPGLHTSRVRLALSHPPKAVRFFYRVDRSK